MAAMAVMSLAANAQVTLGGSVGLETAHLWRGLEVCDGLTVNGDLNLGLGDHVKVGVWGGRELDGSYREFDYYAAFTTGGLTVSLWDIYNYSANYSVSGSTGWDNIFNYNKFSTNHFLDAGVAYNFAVDCNVPLTLSWNTIVQGRDLDGDKQQYSTYAQAAYTVYDDEKWTVTPSVGATLKFAGDTKTNFYGGNHKMGINDLRIAATYKLAVCKHQMPLTATLMWNPELNKGYMGLSISLVQF